MRFPPWEFFEEPSVIDGYNEREWNPYRGAHDALRGSYSGGRASHYLA
jgi:hypothetical protein